MNAVVTTEQSLIPAASVPLGFGSSQGFEQLQRAAKLLASSTLVPKEFQGNLPNCVIALNMANRIGADPLLVMQNLYVVHGRPGWSSKFLIATFNQCGRFSAVKYEWFGERGTDSWGCRAWALEADTGERIVGPDITIQLSKDEGWYGKQGSKWKTIPQLMLMYRAAGWMINTSAPELSMGLQTQEELQDMGELKVVNTPQPPPKTLREAIKLTSGDQAERQAVCDYCNGTRRIKLSDGTFTECSECMQNERPTGDATPFTVQEVHDAITNAASQDALDQALDLVRTLPAKEQQSLIDLGKVVAGKFTA